MLNKSFIAHYLQKDRQPHSSPPGPGHEEEVGSEVRSGKRAVIEHDSQSYGRVKVFLKRGQIWFIFQAAWKLLRNYYLPLRLRQLRQCFLTVCAAHYSLYGSCSNQTTS